MKTPEPEVCYKCGARAPAHPIVLRHDETGEIRYYCRKCGDEWLNSDEPWPPEKTPKQNPQKTP